MITKLLVSAAIVLAPVVGAATASADPSPDGTQPNPFGSLTSNSQQTAPLSGPALTNELNRGIRSALSRG
jgi:hypothetical protein